MYAYEDFKITKEHAEEINAVFIKTLERFTPFKLNKETMMQIWSELFLQIESIDDRMYVGFLFGQSVYRKNALVQRDHKTVIPLICDSASFAIDTFLHGEKPDSFKELIMKYHREESSAEAISFIGSFGIGYLAMLLSRETDDYQRTFFDEVAKYMLHQTIMEVMGKMFAKNEEKK